MTSAISNFLVSPTEVRVTPWHEVAAAVALAAATLIVSSYFAPRGYQFGFVDMAHDGYQLRQAIDLSAGGVIFRDTFDQYGPLNGYLNAVGFSTLGRNLLAIKYLVCASYAVTAVLLFALARVWLGVVMSGFAVTMWLALAPFYQHGIMISPHAYVLLLQTVAVVAVVARPDLDVPAWAVAGVFTGLSWAMKQSMGVLLFAAMLTYAGWHAVAWRDRRGRAVRAAVAYGAGFFGVIAVVLAFLWTFGAAGDWYLQTIVFPRRFYLLEHGLLVSGSQGVAWSAVLPAAAEFVRLQLAQASYWIVIRAVVIVAAAVHVWTRRFDDRVVLMAAVTIFLWAGTYPSANFMHQWWTASLTIPAFVWCVRSLIARSAHVEAVASAATIALVLLIVRPGIVERRYAASFRAHWLNQTIDDPPAFRGIRTDPPTKRAFETMYDVMRRYRDHHPGATVVSIDAPEAVWSGINESLPFLSALDPNPHPQPAYWQLPVLTTETYPRYAERLQQQIRDERPLLIEDRPGAYQPQHIADYALLAAIQSDVGYWYLYAADEPRRITDGDVSTFLARDGSRETGFVERGAKPSLDVALSPNPVGASRGSVPAPRGSVRLYTWPADLPTRAVDGRLTPLPAPLARADIARPADSGWTVDGQATGRFERLVDFPEQDLARGALLIVRGDLVEGGLQVGFVQRDEWVGFVTVTDEGPFEAILEVQRAGRYRATLTNCIEATPWTIAHRHWLRGTIGLLTGRFLPNRFRITALGWAAEGTPHAPRS